MKTSLVFFGGCTGVGKSRLLKLALEQFNREDYEIINISEHFDNCRRNDSGNPEAQIIWHSEHWKEYDKRVLESLKREISNNEKKLVVVNQHFATISPSGYLPGIDLDTLDLLLEQNNNLNNTEIDAVGKKNAAKEKSKEKDDKRYSFGVLLIDTDPTVVRNSYAKQLRDQDKYILDHVSNESILKDLEENRKWAGIYSTRAISVLSVDKVFSDTIYIHDLSKQNKTIDEIAGFFKRFGLRQS